MWKLCKTVYTLRIISLCHILIPSHHHPGPHHVEKQLHYIPVWLPHISFCKDRQIYVYSFLSAQISLIFQLSRICLWSSHFTDEEAGFSSVLLINGLFSLLIVGMKLIKLTQVTKHRGGDLQFLIHAVAASPTQNPGSGKTTSSFAF